MQIICMHYSYFLTSQVPVLQQKSQNYKLAFLRTLRQRFRSRDKIITCVLITKHCLVNRVATVNWMWNLRTFPGPFEQIQRPSVPNKIIIYFIYILYFIPFFNSATKWALQDLILGKNRASAFVFKHCYIEGIMSSYDKQLILTIFLQSEVKHFVHSRIFIDHNPNSRTFQGLEFSFAHSWTFQDFKGPWQPCIKFIFNCLITINVRKQFY